MVAVLKNLLSFLAISWRDSRVHFQKSILFQREGCASGLNINTSIGEEV